MGLTLALNTISLKNPIKTTRTFSIWYRVRINEFLKMHFSQIMTYLSINPQASNSTLIKRYNLIPFLTLLNTNFRPFKTKMTDLAIQKAKDTASNWRV